MKRSCDTDIVIPDDPLEVTYLRLASVSVLVAAKTQHAQDGLLTDMQEAGHILMRQAADLYISPRFGDGGKAAQRDLALDISATALRVVAQLDAEPEDGGDLESETA